MLARSGASRIQLNRWLAAQEYEQAFWQRRATTIEKGITPQLDWYDWKARQLEQRLAAVGNPLPKTCRILEIGSGPIGIVNGLEWGERFTIDPLEQFYRKTPSLIQLRRPGSMHLAGTGEQLPFHSASFSLVIIDNVIDHTYAPAKILQEISRILEVHGLLYLAVNVHTGWGAILHDTLARLQIDRGHPYTFTSQSLRDFLALHGYTVLLEEIDDYQEAKRSNCRSSSLTDRMKGYTGLSEFQHFVLCRKVAAASAL